LSSGKQGLKLLQYLHFQRILFLLWLVVYESCADNDKQKRFQWIRHLGRINFTSDQGDAAFNYVFSLFIKVEAIIPDASVNCSAIEETFDHLKECSTIGEGISQGSVQQTVTLEQIVDHEISL
jgi:hypothetical protein